MRFSLRHHARRAWFRVREPRSITLQQALLYVILGTAGLLAVIDPPHSVDDVLGYGYTAIWAWLLMIGGYGAAVFTPSGAWIWERPFLIALIGAGALYTYSIIAQAMASSSGNRMVQLAWVVTALFSLVIRLQKIFREPYEPGR